MAPRGLMSSYIYKGQGCNLNLVVDFTGLMLWWRDEQVTLAQQGFDFCYHIHQYLISEMRLANCCCRGKGATGNLQTYKVYIFGNEYQLV